MQLIYRGGFFDWHMGDVVDTIIASVLNAYAVNCDSQLKVPRTSENDKNNACSINKNEFIISSLVIVTYS